MKKILFILGFVSQLVAGCSDFFDTAPSNKIRFHQEFFLVAFAQCFL